VPVITVKLSDLESLLGRKLSDEEIYYYLAKLKCEVEALEGDQLTYEANSDRPDLFSVEGLSRALKSWLGIPWQPYRIIDSTIEGYASKIPERPYVALAVVRDLVLSDEAVSQIMQLQEKLTQTYGRGRRKVSIGVYDLKGVKPPIKYELADPDTTRFTPLNETSTMTLREALEKTEKGLIYGYIIKDMKKYPVLKDSEDKILSLVPIINSDDFKVTPDTREVLIDATGTSLDEVINAVTIMATSVVERSRSRVIEAVKVFYPDGLHVEAPRKSSNSVVVNMEDVNRLLGTSLTVEEASKLLSYFYYEVVAKGENAFVVKPPVYRVDVKSWVDVAEDIAIAYGYERLGSEASSLPQHSSIGRKHPIEYYSMRVRDILIGLGFEEVANYMLSSRATQLELLGLEAPMFLVENPKSERFEGVRIWITPQLVETIVENADKASRLAIFEIGDVVLVDPEEETKARVERRVGIAITHDKVTLTDGLAYVRALLRELGITPLFEKHELPGFLAERTAKVIACKGEIGFVGEVDPRILYKLGAKNPIVVAELSLDKVIKLCSI
jgi:phenylalanyl-tRNA synthetase beta chain